MKRFIIPLLLATSCVITTAADAAGARKRPNLEGAHELVAKAMLKLEAAQRANEGKIGEHGKAALDDLSQAQDQIQRAIDEADKKEPPR